MLCFNVCDHFYCLGFQWQLLYVIWKWLLCFDLPQELISESFLYTLIALVFHKFVFCVPVLCVNLGDHLFYLSVMLSVPTLPPKADTQCLMPITPKPISIQSKKDYWIRSSLFPGLILCYCMAMLPSTDFISELIFSQSNVKGPWKVSHTWARRQCTTRPSSPMMLSMYDAFLMPVDTELPWALSKNIFK